MDNAFNKVNKTYLAIKAIALILSFLSLAGCDKIQIIMDEINGRKSPWEYSVKKDQMTNNVEYSALSNHVSDQAPAVNLQMKLICDKSLIPDAQLILELTTFNATPNANGQYDPLKIDLANRSGNELMDMLGRASIIGTELLPKEIQFDGVAYASVRIDEDEKDSILLQDIPAVSIRYTNQVWIFPILIAKKTKRSIHSIRVGIPTQQGVTNGLVDLNDENLVKVVTKCQPEMSNATKDN